MNKKPIAIITAALAAAALLTGCQSAAKTASDNISTAADNFEIPRKIIGLNTRTDKYVFYVEGRCSISREGDLVVTCKHADNDFRKHYIGQANDVAWVSEQTSGVAVSEYRTRIIIKPEGLVPEAELKGSWQ